MRCLYMYSYKFEYEYKYDEDDSWISSFEWINAESDATAIMQLQSSYPYVSNIRIKERTIVEE